MHNTTTKGNPTNGDRHNHDVAVERLTAEVARLEAELVTVRRERVAARAEVARQDAIMRGGGW